MWGLVQSICVTVPVRLNGRVKSNFAPGVCCAVADAAITKTPKTMLPRMTDRLIASPR